MLSRLRVCFVAFICFLTFPALSQTINVPSDVPTIQAAIDAAGQTGYTVRVAPGTYHEHIDFKGKAVTVISNDPTSASVVATTIIDGSASGAVVTFKSGELGQSVLAGFTIQNGGSTDPNVMPISAGIYIANAAPILNGNVITNNICTGIYADSSAPRLNSNNINSTIASTAANCNQGTAGGAIAIVNAPQGVGGRTAYIQGNTIENNHSATLTSAGIYVSKSNGVLIQNNTIRLNDGGIAGGIAVSLTDKISIIQNLICGNKAEASVAGTTGGISFNVAPDTASGIQALIANNTIAQNSLGTNIAAANPTAALQANFSGNLINTALVNNIIYGGSPTNPALTVMHDIGANQTVLVIDHNDIFNANGPAYCATCTDMTGTYGNISADPKLTADYHLAINSPAIDAGNNSVSQMPAHDLGATTARLLDSTSLGYPTVDMGAYEFNGAASTASSSIALTPSSYNPGGDNAPFSITATLNATSAPKGKIDFYVDGAKTGSGTLDDSGTTTFSDFQPSQLTGTVHSFSAKYAGQGATPPSVPVYVNVPFASALNATTTTISLKTAPLQTPITPGQNIPYGTTIEVGATVDAPASGSNSSVNTGTVAFSYNNGAFTYASESVTKDSVPGFQVSVLAVGPYQFAAQYTDTTNTWLGSIDPAVPAFNIVAVQPALTLSADQLTNPTKLTAVLTTPSNASVGGYSIKFYIDGTTTLFGTATMDSSGTATLTPSSFPIGQHTFTAIFTAPNTNFLNAISNTITVTTNTAVGTTTTLSANPGTTSVGQPVTLTITVAPKTGTTVPAGTVKIYDGSTLLDPNVLSVPPTSQNVSVAFTTAGTHHLSAVFIPTDSSAFNQSTGTFDETVNASTISTAAQLTSSLNPANLQQNVTFNVTIQASSGTTAPSGTVIFFDGPTQMNGAPIAVQATTGPQAAASFQTSFSTQGLHFIHAEFTSTNSAMGPATSNSVPEQINSVTTTVNLSATPNAALLQQTVTISAGIVSASGGGTPTGTVIFSNNGAPITGPVPITAQGVATFSTPSLPLGKNNLTATYTPSSGSVFGSSTSAQPYIENIVVFPTSISLSTQPFPTAYVGQQVHMFADLTLPANPDFDSEKHGTVYFYDGSSLIASVPKPAGSQTGITASTGPLSLGMHTLTVKFVPDTQGLTASSSQVIVNVIDIPVSTSISATPNPDPIQQRPSVSVVVTVPTGLAEAPGNVSVTDNGNIIGTFPLQVRPGTGQSSVTFNNYAFALGQHTLVATYAPASINYALAQSPPYLLSVINADFSINTANDTLSIQTEHHKSISIVIASTGGFTAPVTISCGALPQYASCNFTNTTVQVPMNGSVSTTLTIDTDAVLDFKSSVEPAHRFGTLAERISLATLLPLGLAGFTRKRRKLSTLLLLALFVMATLGLTACGNKYPGHTAPGTYAIPISATGTIPGTAVTLTRSFNLTLNVTP